VIRTRDSSGETRSCAEELLLDGPRQRNPLSGFRSRFRTLFRSLKLSLFTELIASRWKTPMAEGKKVAMYEDSVHASLRSVLHLVPCGVAVAILSLNFADRYKGNELRGANGRDD